jgi:hypothetical protein
MNEAHDRLEAELAKLRPHEASADLRQRIADHQARSVRQSGFRWWRLATAGGLAAACIPAIFLLQWGRHEPVDPGPPIVQVQPGSRVETADPMPTVLAYHRALVRSDEELDALLGKHAPVTPNPDPDLARIGPLTRSESALHALLGEY